MRISTIKKIGVLTLTLALFATVSTVKAAEEVVVTGETQSLATLTPDRETCNDFNGSKWWYSIHSGNAEIYWYVPIFNEDTTGVLTVPSTLSGCPVTTVRGLSALNFSGITFPSTVETIGGIVNWDNLKTVTIPSTVKTLEQYAFDGCDSLQTITIENSALDIFDNQDTIPRQATIIGYPNSTAQAYAIKYHRNFLPI